MNPFFEWNAAVYSVHVPEMDREHQQIIACMNKLHSLSQAAAPAAQLARALDDLVAVTVRHFTDEEAYMTRIGFADLPRHKLVHKSLLDKVVSYKTAFEASGSLGDDFFAFLKFWLKAHICGIDVKYGKQLATP